MTTSNQLSFPNSKQQPSQEEQQKKEAYRERLAEALKDADFRKIEGFPIGTDEAILALSDPPYYTACPNPFIEEILELWQVERRQIREKLNLPDDEQLGENYLPYRREPFASDVSEGKNHPIYNAHSYHTKVPHKAIMRYILHYTDPGDIVYDGFCGTGMTGVAAQLCGDRKAVQELGYTVDAKGRIKDETGKVISLLGIRKAMLNDLSPAATFIAYNYNTPIDAHKFEVESKRILHEVEKECGWMYETWHPDCHQSKRVKGKINYTVWSDVFICPQCAAEMVFWDKAVDLKNKKVAKNWNCPNCNALLSKSPTKDSGEQRVERAMEYRFDRDLGETIRQAKQVPVLINYNVGKNRFEKKPDQEDLDLIRRIEDHKIPYPIPTNRMPEGFNTAQPKESHGLTHVHHFYTRRNLWTLTSALNKSQKESKGLKFWVTSSLTRTTKMYKFTLDRKMGTVSGTLYIPSLWVENVPSKLLSYKNKSITKALRYLKTSNLINNSSSTYNPNFKDESCDYVFIDPPFGGNLMYSELNSIIENWLSITTQNKHEAITNQIQKKGLSDYQGLMEKCFKEFFRIIKPSRWMTVEFHNSQNAVWNSIQEAILQSGFILADVRILDKKQGTFKQVTAASAVKQDLILSAYKPSKDFETRFFKEAGTETGAWDFVTQHIKQLPLPVMKDNLIEMQQERMSFLLFDRMVAFHLVRGLAVPISSGDFYLGLAQRFLQRDGMYFTSGQAADYDKLRLQSEKVEQLALFVNDEQSAIQWLRQELSKDSGHGPQTYGVLMPRFIQQLHLSKHEALPELRILLEQNFIQNEHEQWYVPDPEKQSDLEKLRLNALVREFNSYLTSKGRLNLFRKEAVQAGFSKAWQDRAYEIILNIGDRLPGQVLDDDPKLKMYYNNAQRRASKQPKQGSLI